MQMNLYSWGANSHGQLGIGTITEQEIVPTLVKTNNICVKNIKCIKGGGGHTIILDTCGNIYSCGWNNRGQLGIESTVDQQEFSRIQTNELKFETIECGWDISGGVTSKNQIYVWGANYFGNIKAKFFTSLTRIELPDSEVAIDMKFGLRHGMVLAQSGNIYLFGKLKFIDSSLLEIKKSLDFEFYLLKLEYKPMRIASGQNHILIQIDDNKLVAFGNNKHGQCGMKGSGNIIEFKTENIVDIDCGWTHNGVLCDSGYIYLWGRNNYGQLGSLSNEYPKLDIHEKIKLIYLGSEHGLAVTDKRKVYTWGWNEHGNCGNGTVENLFQPEYIPMPGNCCLAGTGAGFCYSLVSN